MNQKKLARKARFAVLDQFEDRDYHTGRTLSGEWKPMPSEEPRDRYNRPIPGGPQYMVNQWDKVLE